MDLVQRLVPTSPIVHGLFFAAVCAPCALHTCHHGAAYLLTCEAPPPPPPLWNPYPILVRSWLELPTRKSFQPGKFATHRISPHLFAFKIFTMSEGMPCTWGVLWEPVFFC